MIRSACEQHEERIALLEAELVVLRAELGEVSAERDELVATVGALRAKVVELTKQAFGARSERGKATAGDDDGPGRAPGAAEDSNGGGGNEGREAGGVKRERGQRPGGHGRRSYDHLPREERVHEPDPELLVCGSCGAGYVAFGEERRPLCQHGLRHLL
jgi:transposase